MPIDDIHYASGDEIHIGDHVNLAGRSENSHLATVVFVVMRNEFSVDFPEHEWKYLKSGFMVKDEKGTLIHYKKADEDITLLIRGH